MPGATLHFYELPRRSPSGPVYAVRTEPVLQSAAIFLRSPLGQPVQRHLDLQIADEARQLWLLFHLTSPLD